MSARIDEIRRELEAKARDELLEELARLKWQLEQIPRDVSELIQAVGLPFVAFMRDGMPFEGVLVGLGLELKLFKIYYEYSGKLQYGGKEADYSGTLDVPKGSCARWFIVYRKEEKPAEG